MEKPENNRESESWCVGQPGIQQTVEQRLETAIRLYEVLNKPIQSEFKIFRTYVESEIDFNYPLNVLILSKKLIVELCFYDEVKCNKDMLDDYSHQLSELLLGGHKTDIFSKMMNEILTRQNFYCRCLHKMQREESDQTNTKYHGYTDLPF